jgi:hypothetical protein
VKEQWRPDEVMTSFSIPYERAEAEGRREVSLDGHSSTAMDPEKACSFTRFFGGTMIPQNQHIEFK